jgi:hypothetical protein
MRKISLLKNQYFNTEMRILTDNVPATDDCVIFVFTPTLIKCQCFPNACREFNGYFIKKEVKMIYLILLQV